MLNIGDGQERSARTAISIRRATPADAAGITAVMEMVTSERIHSAVDRAWGVAEQERHLASLGPREGSHVAIDADGSVVGVQSCSRWSGLSSMSHVAELGTFILPSMRRRGIGQLLWNATREFARDAGYRKLAIQVRGSNTSAQAYYQGLGFTPCGRLTRQVVIDGVEDDEVLMELFL
jgi:ribosomal protein S18 acetylase RimI-like enzyme